MQRGAERRALRIFFFVFGVCACEWVMMLTCRCALGFWSIEAGECAAVMI